MNMSANTMFQSNSIFRIVSSSTNVLRTASPVVIAGPSYSISIWVRVTSNPLTATSNPKLLTFTSGAVKIQFAVSVNNYWLVYPVAANTNSVKAPTGLFGTGATTPAWVHLAAVYTTGLVKLFQDGTAVASGTTFAAFPYTTFPAGSGVIGVDTVGDSSKWSVRAPLAPCTAHRPASRCAPDSSSPICAPAGCLLLLYFAKQDEHHPSQLSFTVLFSSFRRATLVTSRCGTLLSPTARC